MDNNNMKQYNKSRQDNRSSYHRDAVSQETKHNSFGSLYLHREADGRSDDGVFQESQKRRYENIDIIGNKRRNHDDKQDNGSAINPDRNVALSGLRKKLDANDIGKLDLDQLIAYLKQIDPKLEEKENQKIFLEKLNGKTFKWNQDIQKFIQEIKPKDFYQLVNGIQERDKKKIFLYCAKNEQIVYYWEKADPKLEENQVQFFSRVCSPVDACIVEFVKNMEEDRFFDIINFKNGWRNWADKKAMLLNAMPIERVRAYVEKLTKIGDQEELILQKLQANIVYQCFTVKENVWGKLDLLKYARLEQTEYFFKSKERINVLANFFMEVAIDIVELEKSIICRWNESRNSNEKILQNSQDDSVYQYFTKKGNEKEKIKLLKCATQEQIAYFFESEERKKVLAGFFVEVKRVILDLKENIMWRLNKSRNRNHENNLSKFYGKDLWEGLKQNMEECERHYNTSLEKGEERDRREKLKEGYQKTFALWKLYQNKIQYDQLNFTGNQMYYNYIKNGINISRICIIQRTDMQLYRGLETILHESGHFIDFQYDKEKDNKVNRSKTFKNGELYQKARQDFFNMFSTKVEKEQKFVKSFEKKGELFNAEEIEEIAVNKIKEKLGESGISEEQMEKQDLDFEERICDIRDIFENIMSEVITGSRSSLMNSHGFQYWKNAYQKCTEIFAEMFSATLSNWKSAEQIIHFFPTAYDTFLEIVTGMLEERYSIIDFLKKPPTAQELMLYIQLQAKTRHSLVDIELLCNKNAQIESQIKSLIESLDKETCLSYFFMEKHCHEDVLDFLYWHLSEEKQNYIDEKKMAIKENESSYWKNLLKDGNVTLEEFIGIYHREEQIRGNMGLWRIFEEVFSMGGDDGFRERIKKVLESVNDSEILQQLFQDKNEDKKKDTFFQCMQRVFGVWKNVKIERT